LIVAGKCIMLGNIPFSFDKLSDAVQPCRDKITYTSNVGFDSNIDGSVKYDLFLSVKDIVAPKILTYQRDADTLLLVQFKGRPPLPSDYRVISKGENKEAFFLLVTKAKP
jgi:hypothetical protein